MFRSRTVIGEEGTYEEPAYFLMMNSQKLVELIPGNFYATKEKAENNPAFINLERVASKVTCDYAGTRKYQIYCSSSLRTICDVAGL